MKGINEDTNIAETDMIVVTLSSQKLKAWQETEAYRNNWKFSRSAERGRTSNKCRISGGSSGIIVSVIRKIDFCAGCKPCNENEKQYIRNFSNWAEEIHGYTVNGADFML